MLEIGLQFTRYKIVDRLGEGTFSEVYLARDNRSGKLVALKVLRPQYANQPDLISRIERETAILRKLNSPYIAKLYEAGNANGYYYIAQEYVQGQTLGRWLAGRGAVSPLEAINLIQKLLKGLADAHTQGIIHRDIKPENLMRTPDGGLKIMDFGIARQEILDGDSRLTRLGALIGTPAYMSPEAIQGQEIDERTDIYAVGVILYELLTNRIPFESESEWAMFQHHINTPPPRLPNRELDAVVQKAMAKDRANRYRTAQAQGARLKNNKKQMYIGGAKCLKNNVRGG
jgi:eukaryotic-like serine/threonine-protein kinase